MPDISEIVSRLRDPANYLRVTDTANISGSDLRAILDNRERLEEADLINSEAIGKMNRRIAQLEKELAEARAVIERLASSEAFHRADMMSPEVRLRVEYARAFLNRSTHEAHGRR